MWSILKNQKQLIKNSIIRYEYIKAQNQIEFYDFEIIELNQHAVLIKSLSENGFNVVETKKVVTARSIKSLIEDGVFVNSKNDTDAG